MKLHERTPDPVVYFIAGCLPAEALLHLRQFSLFSMVIRLPNNIHHKMARYILTTSSDSSQSWFIQVKKLLLQYNLPHPLRLLDSPLSKAALKKLFKNHVIDFWQTKLRRDAAPLSSLEYFKPQFMSLQITHPLWTSCGSNSYEICKAIIQAKMLSGRYRTDQLLRHFSDNDGLCTLCHQNIPGSIEHLLVQCPVLDESRKQLRLKLSTNDDISDTVKSLINDSFHSVKTTTQMLLDCTAIPATIAAKQTEGPSVIQQIFRFTRSWCYTIHKTRLKLLGRWHK